MIYIYIYIYIISLTYGDRLATPYLCPLIEFLKFIKYNINVVQSKDNTFWHTKLKLIYKAFAIVSMYCVSNTKCFASNAKYISKII